MTTASPTYTVKTVSERQLAKTIDHSLLKPELDDAFIEEGCRLAAEYDVASVCVRPADVKRAKAILDGIDVAVGTVIGFPHGSSTTETKVFEAKDALANGATELDMVIQIGSSSTSHATWRGWRARWANCKSGNPCGRRP